MLIMLKLYNTVAGQLENLNIRKRDSIDNQNRELLRR